ncbi:electrogenic sodium bicarbonate cotransporter 1 isoform X3 [Cuculus canorus]|uniref:electrogenic sodium bicarbonate cotransporter 1 isoform X3 n=1 Tax=Cuculus canorus TaxID=55661 RepID=UPI0023AA8594|nr:electrogenic sodium bicarbonate cotransporter 1 isoform X3 [Cuculus canorus]XP_053921557.1 electrogenic sodium bicarbonate cotransporter 1 isoform X3 [Cuculus canorus]XP_053921558.1 electrogenic sodium bicarbonate cotransporter 1 isoform X3 [Cuculus canorus]XP_053921559.1 electrogenic sodium bicarbonate cotransporter 1 isoform X3 [Cuculus canorus]
MEDEAVLDRGASFLKHVCDEEEVEGHHTIYIGVHVPKSYRRRRRHRRRPGHKEKKEKEKISENYSDKSDVENADETSSSILKPLISPAAERIRFILGEEDDSPAPPQLFTELDELLAIDGQEMEWKETARWIKFEEKVEQGGERWSKPHVATLSLHSLFELRTCIEKGSIMLDMEASSLPQVVEMIVDNQIETGLLKPELKDKVTYTLLRKHRHQTKKSNLRSLADIGKTVSSASRMFSNPDNARSPLESSVPCLATRTLDDEIRVQRSPSVGWLSSPAMAHRNLTSTSLNDISDKPEKDQLKNKFMKKLPRDAEASNVLVGEVDFLEGPFIAFVRLQQAVMLGALTEVPVPTRFLFILLGPKGKAKSYHEIGRAIATLMSDEVFHDIAYKAKDRQDLIAGIDEFLDEVIVLPPGEWDPAIRIEPPKSLPSSDKRKNMYSGGENLQMNGDTPHDGGHGGGGHGDCEELQRTGRFCGGLIKDIKRKAPFFASDFYDALNIQALSAILFIYLATVTNAITFGGLLGDATENMQGVLESFLGTAVTGAIFCLFAGQPLTILSSTGPVLVFERLLFNFSKDNDFDYLEFRLWIGLWSAFQCLILVATDASFLVKYFTRFTEEGFSSLISFIFIYDAFKKMIKLADHYPINSEFKVDYITHYSCACEPVDPVNSSFLNRTAAPLADELLSSPAEMSNSTVDWSSLTTKECLKYGGQLVGNNCDYVPDITLMSFILFFGTYTCSMALKKFKTSRYFPTTARKLISDFAIILSILIFCGIDALVGVDTPKLIVPSEFKPTSPERGWFIPPFGGNPWWVYLAAAIPALLVTILIFMDQQITAVIVNRKEHKLKKGAGYHLDLFWVAVLMIICSFMGLPWYVAATVISIAHIDSLKMETETSAPGEQPKFLGVREQRVTGFIVFILTGVSVFMAPILKFIPMPVLYGVFLYMGVASLNGVQFMDRLKLLLMPLKHQPDFIYLRHVPLRRVHLFTFLQVVCLALLWILKSTVAAIIFPVMILALVAVRKAMDYLFSQHDLSFLDDVIPEKDKKKKEDEKKKKKKKGSVDSDNDDEKNHQHSLNAIRRADTIPFLQSHTMPSPPRTPVKVVPQIRIELEPEDSSYFWRSKGTETTL